MIEQLLTKKKGGDMNITQKRVNDCIEFYETGIQGSAPIASLFDDQDHIIYDQYMEDCSAAIMDRPARNLAQEFPVIGLSVATARQIDAMPAPDVTA